MKRRSDNEGSIYKTPSGKWRAQVTLDGRRLGATSATKAEAIEWIRKTKGQIDQCLTYSSSQTDYKTFVEGWLAQKEHSVRLHTYESYERVTRLYIIPFFGKSKFKDITPSKVQRFSDHMREEKVGGATIYLTHVILHGSLDYAVKIGLLTYNHCDRVNPPKYESREKKIWTEEQVSTFLLYVQGHRHEHLYFLAFTTGMRQSELLGLQWADIDWLGKTLSIKRQAIKPSAGQVRLDRPKTRNGVRIVDLSNSDIAALRSQEEKVHQLRKSTDWTEMELVFPSLRGTVLNGNRLTTEFETLSERAGLPVIRFHDIRHTAASLMLNNGLPVLIVSRRLGHSKAWSPWMCTGITSPAVSGKRQTSWSG
jgi:integrase